MKIWVCGSSPRSGSRNAWTRIKNFNGASRLSNFWIFFSARSKRFPVAIGDHGRNWLYHYDPETKQQSMEWRHSGSPRPKVSECKNPLESSRIDFWDQDGILPLITIERSPFFVWRGGPCCRGDLVGRTTFWIFLSGLQKLEQRAKKCIELRGDYGD